MNILNIIVISIFIISVIIYIILIDSLNLNPITPELLEEEKNTFLTKRQNDINNLNIIGTIVGILLGVVDIHYFNNIQNDDYQYIFIFQICKLIIYIRLISIAGTSYSDYYTLVESNNGSHIIDDSQRWNVAIKPLIPFLCALSIQALIKIIKYIEIMN
jgi:hypothetical protein